MIIQFVKRYYLWQYLEQNASAVNVKLTAEELATIRKAAIASGAIDVPRYGEEFMKWLGVDSPLPQTRK